MDSHNLRVPKGIPSPLVRWIAPVTFALMAATLLLSYWRYSREQTPYAGTMTGRWYFGMTALVTMLFLTFYNVRRKIYRAQTGSLQSWFWGHVYVGTICLMAFIFHVGFQIHGLFNWVLTFSFLAEILSGFIGLFFYLAVRPRLLQIEEQPTLASHLIARIAELQSQIIALQAERSPQLRQAVNVATKTINRAARPLSVLLTSFDHSQFDERIKPLVERASQQIPEEEKTVFAEIVAAQQRLALSRTELFFHRLLRGWVPLHVALSGWLLALVAIHLLTVGYY